jgi:membrane protein required for colicin V production
LIGIDYGIIGLISIFAVIGLIRGFAAEAISLITWAVAWWVGLSFSQDLSIHFRSMVAHASVRMAVSFASLFLLTLIVARLLRAILGQLLGSSGAGGSERFAGLVFGTGRGALLVAILVMLAGLTPLPRDSWWRESNLIVPFQSFALWVKAQIPSGVAAQIDYRR